MSKNCQRRSTFGAVVPVAIVSLAVQGFGAPAAAAPHVFLSPRVSSMEATESVEIEVFVENVVDLRLYEIVLKVVDNTSGSLDLTAVTIDETRNDFVFAGISPLVCLPDLDNLRIICSPLSEDCVTVAATRAYLGTYTFTASSDAYGVFQIHIANEPTTFLLDCDGTTITPMTRAHALVGVGVTIPTVSEWGLIAMTGLVLISATLVFSRRCTAQA